MKAKTKITRKSSNTYKNSAKISSKLANPPKDLEDIISPTLVQQLKKNSIINNLHLSPRNKKSFKQPILGINNKSTTILESNYILTRKKLFESPKKANYNKSRNYSADMQNRKLERHQLNSTIAGHSQTVDSLTELQLPPIINTKGQKGLVQSKSQLLKLKLLPMKEGLKKPTQKINLTNSSPDSAEIIIEKEMMYHRNSTDETGFKTNLNKMKINPRKSSQNTPDSKDDKISNIFNFQPMDEEAELAILPKPQTKLLRRTTIGPSLFKSGNKSNSPEQRYRFECQETIGKAEQIKHLQKVKQISEKGFIEKTANNRHFLEILKEEEEIQVAPKEQPFAEDENKDLVKIIGKEQDPQTEKGKKLLAYLQRKGTLGAKASKRFSNTKTNFKYQKVLN